MTARPLLSIRTPDGRRPLVFSWGVSSFDGWGVYGANLALALADHPVFRPVAAMEFRAADLVLDPLGAERMRDVAALSVDLWEALASIPDAEVAIDAPVLIGLDSRLQPVPSAGGKILTGHPPVGIIFMEHAALSEVERQRAEQFALVAGSGWSEYVLRANGIIATTTVFQGVDTSLFHPAPRAGRFRDRFVVFSGGELQYRKGQDLVVKAFRAFQHRHPVLLPSATNTVAAGQAADGSVDTAGWALANGVPAEALIALGAVPNIAMPHVIREADVAVFPSRCEGGTNLMAMECMACGIPTILSANTGHLDLLKCDGGALRLDRQGVPPGVGFQTQDWGESDVEEIVETLETVWRDRAAAAAIGRRGAAFIAPMTWRRQTELLLRAIESLLP